jgi:2-methylcitrate dehydratase PrpD
MTANRSNRTEAVAAFVADTSFADIDSVVTDRAKLLMLDTVGVGLAAVEVDTAQAFRGLSETMFAPGHATVFGMGQRASTLGAAWLNGCLCNMLDWDSHSSTFVLPAVLAVGELIDADPESILLAYVLGLEAADRIDHLIDGARREFRGPTYRGWYHVSLCGAMGAALAAGKLLGLDARRLGGAMGTASANSGGLRQNMGSAVKSLFSGDAAAAGVRAALLAREGLLGGRHDRSLEVAARRHRWRSVGYVGP